MSETTSKELYKKLYENYLNYDDESSDSTVSEEIAINLRPYSKPNIHSGYYKLTGKQDITFSGSTKSVIDKTILEFRVDGPRFVILPQDVHHVYPPRNTDGDYGNVLPHITLTRDTIPWERFYNRIPTRDDDSTPTPWMALLLFTEDDEPEVEIIVEADYKNHKIEFEKGQPKPKSIKRIKLSDEIYNEFSKISPLTLQLLTHVNESIYTTTTSGVSEADVTTTQHATVIANRLPQRGKRNIVHLVSLENGIQKEMFSLYSWAFTCPKQKDDTTKSFHRLEKLPYGNFHLEVDTSHQNHQGIHPLVQQGMVPMKHHLQNGKTTKSWYHSPMVAPFEGSRQNIPWKLLERPEWVYANDFIQTVKDEHADDLKNYNTQNAKTFDAYSLWISYAAAWQIGRLLTLESPGMGIEIFNYKRALLVKKDAELPLPLPIKDWLDDLSLLNVLPINYLLPHPNILLPERLKFFQIDMNWVDSLIRGACSVGEAWEPPTPVLMRGEQYVDYNKTYSCRTGIILHSQVVADYPDLIVEGYNTSHHQLPKLVERRLGTHILLVIFEGNVQEVEIYLKAKAIHFGLTEDNENEFKKKRKEVKFVNKSKGIVDIEQLATALNAKESSAELANLLFERYPKYRFNRK